MRDSIKSYAVCEMVPKIRGKGERPSPYSRASPIQLRNSYQYYRGYSLEKNAKTVSRTLTVFQFRMFGCIVRERSAAHCPLSAFR